MTDNTNKIAAKSLGELFENLVKLLLTLEESLSQTKKLWGVLGKGAKNGSAAVIRNPKSSHI